MYTIVIVIDPYKQSALIRDYNDLYMKIYDKEKFMNLWIKQQAEESSPFQILHS